MAKAIEEEFARRIAQVPDRFREQTPLPDSKDAILRGIDDLKRGAPNYDRMSAPLAAKIRRQASELQAMFTALGSVEAIYFRGVGPGGYDAYGVKFTNGVAEIRMLLAMDGRAEDVLFRADGNDVVGDVVACSNEQDLRGRPGTSPVHLFLYNNTEGDIQLYRLGPEGKRTAHGTIGGNMSSSVLTTVESPWVIADASGKCLEIVLPGQRTRYHVVEGAGGDGLSRRTAPLAASEPMLRQYIEALGRGEPNYDRMTAGSRGADASASAVQPGHREPAWCAAGPDLSGGEQHGQRHLYGPLRQRHGGMEDRSRKGRHDRPSCAGPPVTFASKASGCCSEGGAPR